MKNLKRLISGLGFCFLIVIYGTSCSKKNHQPVTHTVVISGMQFHPAELSVNKGDTVKWVNKDLVTHNITEYPGKKWTSGPIVSGGSWKKVINKSFNYYCSIHPNMKGTVKIRKGK